jgi:hypothetical protein
MTIVLLEDLQTAFKALGTVVPKKPSFRLLENVLITSDGASLTLSGTDLERGLRLRIPALEDGQLWSMAVPLSAIDSKPGKGDPARAILTPDLARGVLTLTVGSRKQNIKGDCLTGNASRALGRCAAVGLRSCRHTQAGRGFRCRGAGRSRR